MGGSLALGLRGQLRWDCLASTRIPQASLLARISGLVDRAAAILAGLP